MELAREQNITLVREYVNRHFVRQGMCADVCVHDTVKGNPHAHIMLTMRPFERDGTWGAKSKKGYILNENGNRIKLKSGDFKTRKIDMVDWNHRDNAEKWRSGWAEIVNRYLENQNMAERVDHRSFERQGVEQIPTVHLGVAAFQMEKRGIRTECGDVNREIEVTNSQIRQLKARISKLKNWLTEEQENPTPPTLAEAFEVMLNIKQQKGRYKQIADLKQAAKTFNFLQANNIMDRAGLQEKVSEVYNRHGKVGSRLNVIERRLKVLDEHIRQSDIFAKHTPDYKVYKEVKQKYQAEYYERNRTPLALYEAAERYLKQHLNGMGKIPLPSWKAERDKLNAEKKALHQEYHSLKDDVREMEKIKWNVEVIMREESRDQRPQWAHDIGR